jgi:organic hydroperoxide reductase OsmC/OhrA
MSGGIHHYTAAIIWTGNRGSGTSGYTDYGREHTISISGKPDMKCSSDIPFQGDGSKHNPEDFLLCALSSCHMLWFLHLCADAGIIVTDYKDKPTGVLETGPGKGYFTSVVLNPVVTITNESMIDKANSLHAEANKKCFIANSVKFKVAHSPQCIVKK